MKFVLDAVFVFSKDVTEKDVREALSSSKGLLVKGSKDGVGANIEEYSVKGNKLQMRISSGAHVRPHDAVFRLKNLFAKELGPRIKAGVREVRCEKYVIEFPVEKTPEKHVRIPFAEVSFGGGNCRIVIEDMSEDFLQRNYVDRMINLVNEKIKQQAFGMREEHHEIIKESSKVEMLYNDNPNDELFSRKWITRTPLRNQFVFGPQITALSEAIKQAIVDTVYKPLGFVGMMFPKLVSWKTWMKSGHPQGLYSGGFNPYFFAVPKSADPGAWEDITDLIKVTNEVPVEKIMEKLEPPAGGLAFAQCPPFWSYVEGETISQESLPIKVYDWSGPTYRYESGGAHGFERVDELHRIETLWLGTQEQVTGIAESLVEKFQTLMEDVLELRVRQAWVTPWFMAQQGMLDVDEEKLVGTIDFEAYLPYDDRWLEVQNVSNNGNKYPKAFNVKTQKGEVWSGCAGGSFERYLSAFLAQKGFDPKYWPKKFVKYAGKLPDDIGFL